MNKIRVEGGPLKIVSGQVQLTPEQARPRLHCLRAVKPEVGKDKRPTGFAAGGVYDVAAEIMLKAGEEFGYSGTISKTGVGADREAEEIARMDADARVAREVETRVRKEMAEKFDSTDAMAARIAELKKAYDKQLADAQAEVEKLEAQLKAQADAHAATVRDLQAKIDLLPPAA